MAPRLGPVRSAPMRPPASVLVARLASKARLKHLQLLVCVAELGSLQKAAAQVGLSQPAATHALSELESLFEAPLFERHSKGMRPTPLGQAMLPLMANAVRSLQQCAELAAALATGKSTTLRVGAIGAATSGLLSATLPRFSAMHPEMLVDVIQLSPDELVRAISQDVIDIGLCRRPAMLPEGVDFVELLSDRYAIVCGRQHPLARRQVTGIEELAGELWLMPPHSTIAGAAFARLWDDSAVQPSLCRVNARSPVLLASMLSQRDLLVFLPLNVARPFLESGVFCEIQVPWKTPLPALGAITHGQSSFHAAAMQLLEQLKLDGDLADA